MADTNLVYPYEFEGGKKAIASEVNANFEAVKSFANGINASLEDLKQAVASLEKKPTREMLDIFYSFSSIAPTGAYPLWTGETISHCKSLYPQFWKKINNLVKTGNLVQVSNDEYEERLRNYGQCAAFYIDTFNGHIRLPKITKFISGIENLNELAKEENSGLPNITGHGSWAFLNQISTSNNSAVYGDKNATGHVRHTNGSEHYDTSRFVFDASRSNKIYGSSTIVQPPAVKLCLYIQVANNYGGASELNTQVIAEELAAAIDSLETAYADYQGRLDTFYKELREDILEASPVIKEININVTPAMFAADTTYEEYPYCVDIPVQDADSSLVPTVNFSLVEATGNNFAPIALAGDGFVRVYAREIATKDFVIASVILQ